jgi:hypothetical protein
MTNFATAAITTTSNYYYVNIYFSLLVLAL